MPKVAFVVSTVGFHWEEVFGAYEVFCQSGWEVEFFSVGGKNPKADPVSLRKTGPLSLFGFGISARIAPDSADGRKLAEAMKQIQPVEKISPQDIDALYLPGGHGCLFDVNKNELLHHKIKAIYDAKKILSGVCHATSTFAFVTENGQAITAGKKLTGFPDALDEALLSVKAVDPNFLPIPFSNDEALAHGESQRSFGSKLMAVLDPTYTVMDPPFVTGVGPKAARKTARAVVKLHST